MSDTYTQDDIDRYRELVRGNHRPEYRGLHPNVDDLPNGVVASLMVFQWWVFGERLRELGREVLGALRIPDLVDWLERKLTRE